MKIAIVTFFDGPLREIGLLTLPNKQEYAKRHGYDLIVHEHSLAGTRPSAWTKDAAVMQALETHDVVFWTDADSIITDLDRRLESFCDPSRDFIYGGAADSMNNGNFIMVSNAATKRFMKEVWELPEREPEEFGKYILPETGKWSQACMGALMWRDRGRLSFYNCGYDMCAHHWVSGKYFIYHPFGTRMDRRFEYLEERLRPKSFTGFGEDEHVLNYFGNRRGRVLEFVRGDGSEGIARKLVRSGWCATLVGDEQAIVNRFGGFGSCDAMSQMPDCGNFQVISIQRPISAEESDRLDLMDWAVRAVIIRRGCVDTSGSPEPRVITPDMAMWFKP